eukprot:Skav222984  [mRNA]  locus=scaffold1827:144992:152097:+ [translate_table: standard]
MLRYTVPPERTWVQRASASSSRLGSEMEVLGNGVKSAQQHNDTDLRQAVLGMYKSVMQVVLWNSLLRFGCLRHWKASADTSPVASLVNTPPVFAIYACGHVLKGLRRSFGDCGTLDTVRQRVTRRANDVYKIIDESEGFYINKASATTLQLFAPVWTGSITAKVKLTELEEVLLLLQDFAVAFGGKAICAFKNGEGFCNCKAGDAGAWHREQDGVQFSGRWLLIAGSIARPNAASKPRNKDRFADAEVGSFDHIEQGMVMDGKTFRSGLQE